MENGTTQVHSNGKSTAILPNQVRDLVKVPSFIPPVSTKFDRVMDLVRKAAHLELEFKETMAELQTEVGDVGQDELPSVLLNLVRTPQPVIAKASPPLLPAPKRALKKTKPQPEWKNRGGALKAQVLGLMSDKKERKSKAIVEELKAKNPTSIYSVLTELVREGHLMKTRYAHYRLKLRK